ncbi:MAG TPA: hypothetical protein VFD33_02400 [Bacillota bacterium]|nr:hypothetical protein [Bacillota bacterium]
MLISKVEKVICKECVGRGLIREYVGRVCICEVCGGKGVMEKVTTVEIYKLGEIGRLRRALNRASQILQDNGLEQESKEIDCMFGL